jgi:putative iron-regulated protein
MHLRSASLLLLACQSGLSVWSAEPMTVLSPTAQQVAQTHAELAYRSYQQALAAATGLQKALARFTAAPTDESLAAAKTAWRAAHDAYSPTEVFRFQNGPIDREGGPETKINAWPLDEQWVDATVDDPKAGLINAEVPLTTETLIEYNEKDGEKNIATGYHVIEFLLWGQDRDAQGPGNRPLSDFTTAPQAERRRQYLTRAGELLVQHLASVLGQWAPGADNHRKALLAGAPQAVLTNAFTGLVMLAGDELSGERLAVAYETQDQEEEQSCFSDNTHQDTVLNVAGMAMVWSGRLDAGYPGASWSGPSLASYVTAKDPAAATALSQAIAASLAAAKAIPAPFDQALTGANDSPARKAVLATVEALEQQADDTVTAAKAAGIALEFGANANNAVVGFQEMAASVAAIAAADQPTAKILLEQLNIRWLRVESALISVNPILYKEIESAIEGLKSAAVRAKQPKPEVVAAKAEALAASLRKGVAALKAAQNAEADSAATAEPKP